MDYYDATPLDILRHSSERKWLTKTTKKKEINKRKKCFIKSKREKENK